MSLIDDNRFKTTKCVAALARRANQGAPMLVFGRLTSALIMGGAATVAPAVAPPKPAEMPPSSNWVVKSDVSQLDGSAHYSAGLSSSNTIPNAIGVPDPAMIIIRCKSGALETFVNWPPFIGTNDVEAKWKFDDGPIWQQPWTSSQDGTSTFVGTPREFLSRLATAKRLVIDLSPYERGSVEAVFDLGDASVIVAGATKACPA